MLIPFFKYQGTGNDFVMIDNREGLLSGEETSFFEQICHRRFGIGADGVILLNPHAEFDFEMDYFNSDGRRSTMCGNGGRCIAQFAWDLGIVQANSTQFMAIDGLHVAERSALGLKLKMTQPWGFRKISETDYWIHTGSPHYVRFVEAGLQDLDIVAEGRAIRYNDEWRQDGTNVNFVQLQSPGQVEVRTYERGVEDETWSCGTGVTAVAAVMGQVMENQGECIGLQTPGGKLQVHLETLPWLEGPATFVFEGKIRKA